MYKFTSERWELLAKIFLVIALGSSYLSTLAYMILHRMHHANSDKEDDPHKPYPGPFGLFKTMWHTALRYRDIYDGKDHIVIDGRKVFIQEKFRANAPFDWSRLDAIFHTWLARLLWVTFYAYVYLLVIENFNLPSIAFIGVFFHSILGPLHGVIVNYFGHKFGEQKFDTGDTSRNFTGPAKVILPLQGETEHNKHHARPSSPDFSLGEGTDGSYKLMKWLNQKGVILMKTP